MALDHFRRNGVTGWVLGRRAAVAGRGRRLDPARRYAMEAEAPRPADESGVTVRGLGRDEVGAVGRRHRRRPATCRTDDRRGVAGAGAPPRARRRTTIGSSPSWTALPVGAGSLHTHHRVGWLRAGSVLPAYRGRGIQRALIARAHRARPAAGLRHGRRVGHRGRRLGAPTSSASGLRTRRPTRRSYRGRRRAPDGTRRSAVRACGTKPQRGRDERQDAARGRGEGGDPALAGRATRRSRTGGGGPRAGWRARRGAPHPTPARGSHGPGRGRCARSRRAAGVTRTGPSAIISAIQCPQLADRRRKDRRRARRGAPRPRARLRVVRLLVGGRQRCHEAAVDAERRVDQGGVHPQQCLGVERGVWRLVVVTMPADSARGWR